MAELTMTPTMELTRIAESRIARGDVDPAEVDYVIKAVAAVEGALTARDLSDAARAYQVEQSAQKADATIARGCDQARPH